MSNVFTMQWGNVCHSLSVHVTTTKRHKQNYYRTPYYLAPELCEGRSYDFRVDVWALGCTIYELVTRTKAFSANSIAGLVNMICKGEPPQLKNEKEEDELPELIASMLVKDPSKRPNMRELRDMFEDIFRHHEDNWEKQRHHFEKRRQEALKDPDAKHLTRTTTDVRICVI